MKSKMLIAAIFTLMVPVVFIALAEGRLSPKHADRNKDGVVDQKEWRMEKAWEHRQKTKANTWWEQRADTNGDGQVDKNELAEWKKLEKERIDLNNDGVIDAKERRLCWRHARSRVNTLLEKKYDANSNGWLEPDEIKAMLTDKYAIIKTHGNAVVDTEIEAEYDTNGDGIIDTDEGEALKEDLWSG